MHMLCRLWIVFALVTVMVPAVAHPQAVSSNAAGGPPLAFEIVSIRPDPATASGRDHVATTPDGWQMTHSQLMTALLTAYVPTTNDAMMYTSSTLIGLPDWIKTEFYTIEAKVPESDLPAWHDPIRQTPMLRAMMRSMLADRCKLAVHRSTREVTVYSIVVGKNGPRLQPSVPGEAHAGAMQIPGGGEFVQNDGNGNIAFYDAPVQALAVVLANLAGRPVKDQTGLTGRYDMKFRRPRLGDPAVEPDSGTNPPPTIFEVAESLGLKLVAAKSIVETLTIDHMERPSAN